MPKINPFSYFLLVMTGLTLIACEHVIDWELKTGDNQKLVVEAIITDEFKIQELQLSLSTNGPNDVPPAIEDAIVNIFVNQDTYAFEHDPARPGHYKSGLPFAATPNTQYDLFIIWQGQEYFAKAFMGAVSPFPPATFTPFAETDSFTVAQVASVYHPTEAAMYELNINWQHIFPSDSSQAKLYYYTFNTVDVSELAPPPRELVVFPRGSIVIEKKFGLQNDFAAFLRAQVMETEWKGGVFDEASASLPTNISNDGLGWFGVCAVKVDTFLVQ